MTGLREQLQTQLGDAYAIHRELGGGGMSRVFLADEMTLRRQVVIKVLPADLSGNVSIERFRREISLSARLQHPHIVPLLSAGDVNGQPYYTMPFVEGESLRAKLLHGELPITQTVSILRDVARALEYAHAKGVAHRDIKPDNVLLAGTAATIADFGVAKALSDATVASQLTSIGVALGTPAYMAPEQSAADPSTDTRADIYAFGVVAYEMLAGHVPFAGRNTQATMAAHATETPTAISALRSATPPRLAELVMQCLEKRAGDRPQTASAILQVLDDVNAPSAERTPRVERGIAHAHTGRRIAMLAGVIAVVAAASGITWKLLVPSRSSVRSVAVLPFVNVSGDTAVDYLVDGVSDELRSGLTAAFPELNIKARSSSQQFRGSNVDVKSAGAKLSVGVLLQGTVRRIGSRLHVTADMVNVENERSLWSVTLEVPETNPSAAQDSILRVISNAFKSKLEVARANSGTQMIARGTSDLQANNFYLRGQYAYTRFDFVKAESLFKAALSRDSNFARAEGALALTYSNEPVLGADTKESNVLARAAIARTLALDSTVTDTYVAQSNVLASEVRFSEAYQPLETALRFDSTDATVIATYGYGLNQIGRIDDAVRFARKARDRDPLSPTVVGSGSYVLECARHFDESIKWVREAVKLDPNGVLSHQGIAFMYAFTGQPDSALVEFQRTYQLDPKVYGRSVLVLGYAIAGRWADADRERALMNRDDMGGSPNHRRMMVHLAYGEFDDAMKSLEQSVENREGLLGLMSIPCDPVFDPLKSNVRFAVLMKRLNIRACPASGRWPIAPRHT